MKLSKSPKFYWIVHIFLLGPLVVLWAGVAYWFGYGSGAILKTFFPSMSAPIGLFALTTAGFGWTALHSKDIPPQNHLARGIDMLLCIFLGFSMFIVAGQVMSQ
jgi:hypothetical protein